MVATRYNWENTAPAVSPAYAAAWGGTASTVRMNVGTGAGLGIAVSENSATPINLLAVQVVSAPLAAGAIMGTFRMALLTSNAQSTPAFLRVVLRVIAADGTVRGTLLDATDATALPNGSTQTVTAFEAAMTQVTAVAGDRLVLEYGAYMNNTTTTTRSINFGTWGSGAADLAFTDGSTTAGRPWFEIEPPPAPNPPTGLTQTGATPTSVDTAWTLPATGTAPTGVGSSTCFAMVRGSGLRVTRLGPRGEVLDPITFATSKAVAKVTINEIVEAKRDETLRNPEEERRLRFTRSAQTIRHTVDIDFLRVDPELFSLITGVPLVWGAAVGSGFGEVSFGDSPFGVGNAPVVGFDSTSRMQPQAFALEVWSKLVGYVSPPPPATPVGFDEAPFDVGPFGGGPLVGEQPVSDQRWGYTLFPYLKGGRLSGFKFQNGLVSFSLIGAQTRRNHRWGVGPYDLDGPFQRAAEPVSRNTSWRMFITAAAPPVEQCGSQEMTDVLDNGTAPDPMPEPDALVSVDAGGVDTQAWIIDGGQAS